MVCILLFVCAFVVFILFTSSCGLCIVASVLHSIETVTGPERVPSAQRARVPSSLQNVTPRDTRQPGRDKK